MPAITSKIAIGDVSGPPLGLAEGGDEAHHSGHNEPHAEDQDEGNERAERFLDQHQTGDRAQHADHREHAAAFTPAKDRSDDRYHAVEEQQDPRDHGERAKGFMRRADEEDADAKYGNTEQHDQPPEAREPVQFLISKR